MQCFDQLRPANGLYYAATMTLSPFYLPLNFYGMSSTGIDLRGPDYNSCVTAGQKSVPQSQTQSIQKKRMVIEYILNKIQQTDFQYMMVFLTHTMH